MGLFDDLGLNEFLDDVRTAGEELASLKDDVMSSVGELGRELIGNESPEDEPETKVDQ